MVILTQEKIFLLLQGPTDASREHVVLAIKEGGDANYAHRKEVSDRRNLWADLTIQGEGRHVGIPCHFIRFGGCDYRCGWC